MPTYRYVGDRLRVARDQADLSREDLASEAGCSASAITLYELGYRQPPPPRLVTLAALLRVPVEDFFEGHPE